MACLQTFISQLEDFLLLMFHGIKKCIYVLRCLVIECIINILHISISVHIHILYLYTFSWVCVCDCLVAAKFAFAFTFSIRRDFHLHMCLILSVYVIFCACLIFDFHTASVFSSVPFSCRRRLSIVVVCSCCSCLELIVKSDVNRREKTYISTYSHAHNKLCACV